MQASTLNHVNINHIGFVDMDIVGLLIITGFTSIFIYPGACCLTACVFAKIRFKEIQGTVYRVYRYLDSGTDSGKSRIYSGEYVYTYDGRRFRAQGTLGTNNPPYHYGKSLAIRVDPERPEHVAETTKLLLVGALLVGFPASMIIGYSVASGIFDSPITAMLCGVGLVSLVVLISATSMWTKLSQTGPMTAQEIAKDCDPVDLPVLDTDPLKNIIVIPPDMCPEDTTGAVRRFFSQPIVLVASGATALVLLVWIITRFI